jgi:hypothetical protein
MMATPTTEATDQRAGWQFTTIAAVTWSSDGDCGIQDAEGWWLGIEWRDLHGVRPHVGDALARYVADASSAAVGQRNLALTIGEALIWDKRTDGHEQTAE